jgi:murein DD-endopeptidase MepM/ murein hydrolase activator NlpD
LNRPVSPLLHDYKPTEEKPAGKPKAIFWFIAGLGVPLVVVGLIMSLTGPPEIDVAAEPVSVNAPPAAEAAQTERPAAAEAQDDAEATAEDYPVGTDTEFATLAPSPEFRPPMMLEPDYASIELTIRSGDTLDRIFRKNDLNLGHLAAIVNLQAASKHLRMLRPGDKFEIQHEEGDLVRLYRELNLTSALIVSKDDAGFSAEIIDRPIELRRRQAYGKIKSSLFESAASAGLPDKLIMNLAGIFAWDVDFVLDIRSNDDYYILYEEIYQNGEFVTDGEIVAAEFNNNGRTFQAIRFVDKGGRSDYYTPDGRSVRKAFVRAPVDFTRISSSFNPRRRHPVLNTIRAHRGVDYAAPQGTSIKAAGDGKVIFRGRKGGYGNAVILQHGGNITTLYAHMSRFANSARVGTRVKQGQTIGYVGSTGLATAAHLHYEYRLNGVHRNPRTVQLPQAEPIKAEYRQDFLSAAEPILDELLQYKRTQIAALTID